MLQLTHQQIREAGKIFELFNEQPFSNYGLFQCSERESGEILKQVLVKIDSDEDSTQVQIAAQLENLESVSISLVPVPGGYLPLVQGHETSVSDEHALEFALNYLSDIRFEMEKRQRQGQGGGGNKEGYYVEARSPSSKNELYIEAAIRDGVFTEEFAAIIRRMGFRVQGQGSKVIN